MGGKRRAAPLPLVTDHVALHCTSLFCACMVVGGPSLAFAAARSLGCCRCLMQEVLWRCWRAGCPPAHTVLASTAATAAGAAGAVAGAGAALFVFLLGSHRSSRRSHDAAQRWALHEAAAASLSGNVQARRGQGRRIGGALLRQQHPAVPRSPPAWHSAVVKPRASVENSEASCLVSLTAAVFSAAGREDPPLTSPTCSREDLCHQGRQAQRCRVLHRRPRLRHRGEPGWWPGWRPGCQ